MMLEDIYAGREASAVKHFVLARYLEKLAYKVGSWCKTLNYVEGFAGPWQSHTEDLSDTSPHIAVRELRKARDGLRHVGRETTIRCVLCEKNPGSSARLRASLKPIDDVETLVLQGDFLDNISAILQFTRQERAGEPAFTFLFADPTGWVGLDAKAIARLLPRDRSELLITFMTKDIIRFIDDKRDAIAHSFEPLFGSREAWLRWRDLAGKDREEAIVAAFRERLKEATHFRHVVASVVLHPTRDRTHFHLIFGTNSDDGLREFRGVERKSIPQQDQLRETRRQTERMRVSGQIEMFAPGEIEAETDLIGLRDSYRDQAFDAIREQLQYRGTVPYDELEILALQYSMVSQHEVKGWIRLLQDQRLVRLEGLRPRERTPKPNRAHLVAWIG